MKNRILLVFPFLLLTLPAQTITLDDSPTKPREWGIRPISGKVLHLTPPAFCWRPEWGITTWELEISRKQKVIYSATKIKYTVHCPPQSFLPGKYTWRRRGFDKQGLSTAWSIKRDFRIAPDATTLPLPKKSELLARIPQTHPRLFLRPEGLPRLKQLAKGRLHSQANTIFKQCRQLLKAPPSTELDNPGVRRVASYLVG